MTEESAKAYFDLLHPKTGEMSDDELDNVSGGGCRGNDDRMVTTLMSDCEHWKCKKDGSSAPTGSPGYLRLPKCPKCKCIVRCSNCRTARMKRGCGCATIRRTGASNRPPVRKRAGPLRSAHKRAAGAFGRTIARA